MIILALMLYGAMGIGFGHVAVDGWRLRGSDKFVVSLICLLFWPLVWLFVDAPE